MRLMIASDLHGSSECVEKLLKRVDIEKVDSILLLGDILYHGPRNNLPVEYDTQKTAKLLNEKKDMIMSIRGNCDAEVDEVMLDFDIKNKHMMLSIDGLNIFATHGHFYNTGNLPPMASIDVLLHGHTHIPACEKITDNKYYINPGSVSIPKGGSINSYIILENKKWEWKDLDGNVYKEVQL